MDWWGTFAVLNPQGPIGLAERGLMLHAIEYMLIVAVPVVALAVFFAWRYRASNRAGDYAPEWENSKLQELIWWAVPFEIVLILGALTWSSTHLLDPRVPLSKTEPMVVQAVALDWKWLFLYPAEKIASVNYIRVPVGEAVRFDITADAPMNSFWVPALGGQVYAMTGMVNSLNVSAGRPGVFAGVGANYSGEGFSKMKFSVEAVSRENFDAWVAETKASSSTLSAETYAELAAPSVGVAQTYALADPHLFSAIISKYLNPQHAHMHTH